MPWSERIVVDPEVLAGKPVIRGTRLAVEFILEFLAAGQSENELLTNYPGLTREDILACLSYASYLAHEYRADWLLCQEPIATGVGFAGIAFSCRLPVP